MCDWLQRPCHLDFKDDISLLLVKGIMYWCFGVCCSGVRVWVSVCGDHTYWCICMHNIYKISSCYFSKRADSNFLWSTAYSYYVWNVHIYKITLCTITCTASSYSLQQYCISSLVICVCFFRTYFWFCIHCSQAYTLPLHYASCINCNITIFLSVDIVHTFLYWLSTSNSVYTLFSEYTLLELCVF